MSNTMRAIDFSFMSLWYKLRDLLAPPESVLAEVEIRPGFHLLDYGCGPGSYSLAAAELVGQSGIVYAADINPLGIERVQKAASGRGLSNIRTIDTDCATGLEGASMDVVLLYDTYHDLAAPDDVLQELHRVLKPGGIPSFSDHHMAEEEIVTGVTGSRLFSLSGKGEKTYTFLREG